MKSSRARVLTAACAAAVLAIAVPALAADAGFYAENTSGWHNSANPSSTSASIPVGGSVTWENRDTKYSHPVECVQSKSNETCPWSGAKDLPPKPSLGSAHQVSATFSKPGTYAFRCAIHPTMKGTVIVGSGKPAGGSTPAPTPKSTQTARSSVRASSAPVTSVSPSATVQAKAKNRAANKKARARSSVVAAPSVLGKRVDGTSASGPGRLGGIIPALLMIGFVVAGHVFWRRRQTV